MNKIAYLALLAAPVAAVPAFAQEPSVLEQEGMEQFSPAQKFGYGLFVLSQQFVEITDSPDLAQNTEAAAEKIEKMTQVIFSLYDIPMTDEDREELRVIQSKLVRTKEFHNVQKRGADAAQRIKAADYYGSERLKNAIRDFTMAGMGFRRGE